MFRAHGPWSSSSDVHNRAWILGIVVVKAVSDSFSHVRLYSSMAEKSVSVY